MVDNRIFNKLQSRTLLFATISVTRLGYFLKVSAKNILQNWSKYLATFWAIVKMGLFDTGFLPCVAQGNANLSRFTKSQN